MKVTKSEITLATSASQQVTAKSPQRLAEINLPWRAISNIPAALPSPHPLPSGAAWMCEKEPTHERVFNPQRPPSQKPTIPATMEEPRYAYHPPQFPVSNDPAYLNLARQYLNHQDYIATRLPQLVNCLERSEKQHIRRFSSECKKIINLKENIKKQVREKTTTAYQEHKVAFNLAISKIDNEHLQNLLADVSAICNPHPRDLMDCQTEILQLFCESISCRDSFILWCYLADNEQLKASLERSHFGTTILTEIEEILWEENDDTVFSDAQLELLEKLLAFCQPLTGKHLHRLCEIDLTGKNVQAIIHTLLNNRGIEETLKQSDYGLKLWHELENYPVSIGMLNFRKKIEHTVSRIEEKNHSLSRLKSLPRFYRMMNFLNIRNTKNTIRKLTNHVNFELKVRDDIILAQDAFFKTLQKIQNSGIDSTLKNLLDKDFTLQNSIARAISLHENAERVTPELLYHPQKTTEFVTIASTLAACRAFAENINGSIQTLNSAMIRLYPDSKHVEDFVRSLKNDKDEVPFILAAGHFLPPHMSWQDRKQALVLLSNVINARKNAATPARVPPAQHGLPPPDKWVDGWAECLQRSDEWSGCWADYLDNKTRTDIVNSWFDHHTTARQHDDIFAKIALKVATSLAPETIKRNYATSIALNDNLVNKLAVNPKQQQHIKQCMMNFLLSENKYSVPALKSAHFNLDVAAVLDLLPEKLAYDLSNVGLTPAHYHNKHANIEDILLTDSHLTQIDHLAIWSSALEPSLTAWHAVERLRDILSEHTEYTEGVEGLFALMEDIIFDGMQYLDDFRREVKQLLHDDEILFFDYYQAGLSQKLTGIRDTLLSYSGNGLADFFATLEPSGIRLPADKKNALQDKIRECLVDESASQEKSARIVLSYLLHHLFSSGQIVTLPAPKIKGHRHEYLHALSARLQEQMFGLIEAESHRILASFALSSEERMAYINSSCQLISEPDNCKNILSRFPTQKNDPGKLSRQELDELTNGLQKVLLTHPENSVAACELILNSLRQQRNNDQLHTLASLVYWYNFLHSQRNRYFSANSDSLRTDILQQMLDSAHHPYIKYLAAEFDLWRQANTAPLADIPAFIQTVNNKHNLTETVTYHITLLNIYLQDATREFDDDTMREYKKAVCDIETAFYLAAFMESNAIAKAEHNHYKLNQDFQRDADRQYEAHYKYVLRDWNNQNHALVTGALALEREYEWYNRNLYKAAQARSSTKTSRYLEHLWHEREIYVVFEQKTDLTSRVVIRDKSGPVIRHKTIDEEIPAAQPERYAVAVKVKHLDEEYLDELEASQFRSNPAPRKETWMHTTAKEKVPDVDGFKLLKIIVQEADKINYKAVKIVNRRSEFPAKSDVIPADLAKVVSDLKDKYLQRPDITRTQVAALPDRAPMLALSYGNEHTPPATPSPFRSPQAEPTASAPSGVISAPSQEAAPLSFTDKPVMLPMPAPLISPQATAIPVPAPARKLIKAAKSVLPLPMPANERALPTAAIALPFTSGGTEQATSAVPSVAPVSKIRPLQSARLPATLTMAQYPSSARLIQHLNSPAGWEEEAFECVPLLITRTPMYHGKILAITDAKGRVTEVYDSLSGDTLPKSALLSTRRPIGAIRLRAQHYDAWLPDNGNTHHFVAIEEKRKVSGNMRDTGTVYCLDTASSSIANVAPSGFCLTDAAAHALNLPQYTGAQLRRQLSTLLASGAHEAMLAQSSSYHLSS